MNEKRECDCTKTSHDHGTRSMYQHHRCRCFPCRLAAAQSSLNYKNGGRCVERLIDPTGTVRRLQALSYIGVSRAELAERLGVSERAVQYLRNTKGPVQVGTARRVAAVYDELWSAQRTGRGPSVAKSRAIRLGWAPPLAWDDIDDPTAVPLVDLPDSGELDEVIVERIMSGRSPGVAGAERKEAVRRLAAFGMSDSDIGRRIGMGSNNVQWFRIRHGIPGGVPRPGVSGGGGVAA